ncbi:MAG: hypothetical protein KIS61_09410 [Candidatus Eremiobacteraeota bacterium]|nr:hypothetical protein [Candidatus Eremiobacteraeota bacterium]
MSSEARDLLQELTAQGVSVTLDGPNLRFKSATGLLDRHRSELVRLKPDIIALLTPPAPGPQPPEQARLDPQPSVSDLRRRLGTDLAACATCSAYLSPGRIYQCEGCEERHQGEPGATVARWAADGSLRIPLQGEERFRWWAGGQDLSVTVAELGGTQEQLLRYAPPPTGLGTGKAES